MKKKSAFLLPLFFCCAFVTASGCSTPEVKEPASEVIAPHLAPVWPPPPQTPRIRFVRIISGSQETGAEKSWFKNTVDSIFGSDETEDIMLRPYGVFAGGDRVYITDPGARILHVFNIRDRGYLQISKAGKEEFVSPIGVAADRNGEIYMSDSLLRKIFVFNKEGDYLRDIGSPELLSRPAGIAVDSDRVYVVDTHAHRVLVFTKGKGELLFSFGKNGAGEGDFNFPTNIFIGRDGLVYIMDSLNFRVQIFGKDGKFLSAFGKLGDGSGDFSKPKGIAVDSEGHVYVADAHFDNVQIFDRNGKLLLGFGNTGKGIGEMILPAGVFIDENDMVYVADSYNSRVQVFQYIREGK